MKERYIFDTLPRLPEGVDTSHAGDTERIRERVHAALASEKAPHHTKKRRRFIPMLVAAAMATVVILVAGIAVGAHTSLTPEQEMQRELTERFNLRVKEIANNDEDKIAEKYKLSKEDLTEQAKSDPEGKYMKSVEAEAAAQERQKVCDIVNEHLNNKYEGYNGYYMIEPDEEPSVEDRMALYDFVWDCSTLFACKDMDKYGGLTVEEQMLILNYFNDVIYEIEDNSHIDYQYYYDVIVQRNHASDDYFEFLNKHPFCIDKLGRADGMCQQILLGEKTIYNFKTYYPERTTEAEYIYKLQELIESEKEPGVAYEG